MQPVRNQSGVILLALLVVVMIGIIAVATYVAYQGHRAATSIHG